MSITKNSTSKSVRVIAIVGNIQPDFVRVLKALGEKELLSYVPCSL